MKHRKITQTERTLLSQWKKEGLSNNQCAKRLGRHISTIGRELHRNKTKVSVGKDWEMIYEPTHAQYVAMGRKQHAWLAKEPLKNKQIYTYVLAHLRDSWSPEQISGRLREEDHTGEKDWQICMETIYAFIYKEKSDLTRKGIQQQSPEQKTCRERKTNSYGN
jgi:IS30 family transposase